MRIALFSCLFFTLAVLAQTADPPPSCDPSPEIAKELKRLDIKENLPSKELLRRQKAILNELLAKYPDNLFIHASYVQTSWGHTNADYRAYTTVVSKYADLAKVHPNSLQFRYLYARALVDIDTPKAIDLLKQDLAIDPTYPWPHLGLAYIERSGKFADKEQVRHNLDSFFAICPGSSNEEAWASIQTHGSPEMAGRYAAKLRQRLVKETDREKLRSLETAWNLEFQAAPVTGHEAIRQRIAADLLRLDTLPGQADASWLSFLKSGHAMAGDQAAVKRIEEKLLTDYPQSPEADAITTARWEREHPYPTATDPDEKKQAYFQADLRRTDEALAKTPGDLNLLFDRLYTLGQVNDTSAAQIRTAADNFFRAQRADPDWGWGSPIHLEIAKIFVKKRVGVELVPGLVEQAGTFYHMARFQSDRESDTSNWRATADLYLKIQSAIILTEAARQLSQPEIAKAAEDALRDVTPPESVQSSFWYATAKFAELEGRKLDALILYHRAIETRSSDVWPPDKEELLASEQRLFHELGGSPATRILWEQKEMKTESADEFIWQKPAKNMPRWELSDLHGKTWKMAALEGKTLLINVWASWCGPCEAEHPYLEKLYQQLKDRPDVQVLTFNIDEEVGKVAPYMQERGFTFPVLLARNYVDDLVPTTELPRNWIVDAHGKWLWEQLGFSGAENWQNIVLQKIQQSKASQ